MGPIGAFAILASLASIAVASCRAAGLAGCGAPEPSFCAERVAGYHEQELLRRCEGPVLAQRILDDGEPARRSLTTGSGGDRARSISPGLAFAMSAILPGSGQLAEGRRRAFAYLGMEALAWIGHLSWKDAGNKKEGEYEAYARSHWDFETWKRLASGDVDSCLTALPPGVDRAEAEQTLLNFLAQGNYQHYYEDIGKLEAYRAGWDDFDCDQADAISSNRREYRGMRSDSNDYLKKARLATTFAFLNRVVSAVDAYRTARGARLDLAPRTSIELGFRGSLRDPGAVLRIRRSL